MSSNAFGSSSLTMDGSTSRSSTGGGRRRARATSPIPLSTLLKEQKRVSSSGPTEPGLSVVKPGGNRGFANNAGALKEMPTPDYFNRVVAQMLDEGDPSGGLSSGGGSNHISPFSFPDDNSSGFGTNNSTTMMELEDGAISEEFSLGRILAERSQGTDDQLKQREMDRMKEANSNKVRQFQSAVGSTNVERSVVEFYLEMCNNNVETAVAFYKEQNNIPTTTSNTRPRSVSPPRTTDRQAHPKPLTPPPRITAIRRDTLSSSGSLHRLIMERSHGMTDDEIKQQELDRMKQATTVGPTKRASEPTNKSSSNRRPPSPQPQQRVSTFPQMQRNEEPMSSLGSLRDIISERSHGITDNEIKQQELDRMKGATVVGPNKRTSDPTVSGRRQASPKPQQRVRSPAPRRAPQPMQRNEEPMSSLGSLCDIISERSHGTTDDEIKQQELDRMKGATVVSPPKPNKEAPKSPKPRPLSPPASPKPEQYPRAMPIRGRSPTQRRPPQEPHALSGSLDPLRSQSFHQLIAERSHGNTMTDDEIKQQELDRMKNCTAVGTGEKGTPRQASPKRPSPRQQTKSQPKQEETELLSSGSLHRIIAARSNNAATDEDIKQQEKERMKDSTTSSRSQTDTATRIPGEDQDAQIKQQEEDMTLNSIIRERANNATAEALVEDEDSRTKRESNSSEDNAVSESNNNDTTAAANPTSDVEYGSRGQPLVKHKLPAGSKRPGAYSGAPGTGYNRVQSLRFDSLRNSDQSATHNMGSSSLHESAHTAGDSSSQSGATNNQETSRNQENRNKPSMQKTKSFRKRFGKVKVMFKFLGRRRKSAGN